MNVAHDRAIKAQIADQIGRVTRRECGIDIKTVPGRIIVFLRDVDLCNRRESGSAANSNEKRKFHSRGIDDQRPFFDNKRTVCQGFRAAQWLRKVTAVVFVLAETQGPREAFPIQVRIENP